MKILPNENTTAFGGDAAGNIKAKEQASVTGTIKVRGLWLLVTAKAAITGRIRLAMATLETTSVMKDTIKQQMNNITMMGSPPTSESASPKVFDNPVTGRNDICQN